MGLGCVLGRCAVLDQVLRGVKPEAVDADVVEPVLGVAGDLGGHRGIDEVEIRQVRPEPGVVEALAVRLPVRVLWAVGPDVPVGIRSLARLRCNKPRVLRRRVIERHVENDGDPPLVGCRDEGLQVGQCAVVRVDAAVVGHVIAVI